MQTTKTLPLFLLTLLLTSAFAAIASVNVLSGTWNSPIVYFDAKAPLQLTSTWTSDQLNLVGTPFIFDVIINDSASAYSGVLLNINIFGTTDPAKISLEYLDTSTMNGSTWRPVTLTVDGQHLRQKAFAGPGGDGYNIPAGQTVAIYFRFNSSLAINFNANFASYKP